MKETLIILSVLFIVTLFLIFCWIFVATWYDEMLDFIAKIKPFDAKRKYKKDVRETKRDCKEDEKRLKKRILNERNEIKEEINSSIGYCYVNIFYTDNLDWLKKKGFKATDVEGKAEYKISWSDTE